MYFIPITVSYLTLKAMQRSAGGSLALYPVDFSLISFPKEPVIWPGGVAAPRQLLLAAKAALAAGPPYSSTVLPWVACFHSFILERWSRWVCCSSNFLSPLKLNKSTLSVLLSDCRCWRFIWHLILPAFPNMDQWTYFLIKGWVRVRNGAGRWSRGAFGSCGTCGIQ